MAQYQVTVTDFGGPEIEIERAEFRAAGLDVELTQLNAHSEAELLVPAVAEADALIVQFAPVTRNVIATLKRCRVMSRYGIGVDSIDLKAASEKGIMVANVPDYCIQEVSTDAIAFMLCLNRHVVGQNNMVRSGKWAYPKEPTPQRLPGQTLGIVGLGNIGRAVAQKALGLGLKIVAYDPFVKPEQIAGLQIKLLSLEELLRTADYVSLHCPLIESTRHLIGAPQLAMMKKSAFLMNLARGAVVDQQALTAALQNGTIAGAALDVLEKEPPDPNDPLLKMDNVILSPHSASMSDTAIVQLRQETARNVIVVLQGKTPRSVVNRRDLNMA